MDNGCDWLEDAWRYRDQVLYPEWLGAAAEVAIAMPSIVFEQMGIKRVDRRWLQCRILTFPPASTRSCFSFVTAGLSNVHDVESVDPDATSGLGIELRIDHATDEHWPKEALVRVAATQLIIAAGRFPGGRLLRHGDEIVVGMEKLRKRSAMRALFAVKMADLRLRSGRLAMIHLFPITEAERQLAASEGSARLLAALREKTSYPVSDLARSSVV